jgi:hypothetical protein
MIMMIMKEEEKLNEEKLCIFLVGKACSQTDFLNTIVAWPM